MIADAVGTVLMAAGLLLCFWAGAHFGNVREWRARTAIIVAVVLTFIGHYVSLADWP